jgi:hypothetical protein
VAIKLGELLVKANVITEVQLKAALAEQHRWGGKLGDILVRMEFCNEEIMVKALAKQLNIQRAELDQLPVPPEAVIQKLSPEVSEELCVVPLQLRDEGRTLVVALAEPQNIEITDSLRARTGCRIVALIAGASAIARARARFYHGEAELGAAEGGFKVTDAQGRTLVKDISHLTAAPRAASSSPPPVPARPSSAPAQRVPEILGALEEVQRKEVAALKAMVEILIEKGVFTREEYLARVKR